MQITSAGKDRQIQWILFSAAYLIANGVGAVYLPGHLAYLSTLGIVIAQLIASCLCIREARAAGRPIAALWLLLGCSILLQATAMSLDVRAELLGRDNNPIPSLQILFSTLFAVPLLVAVSTRLDRRFLRPVPIINALEAIAAGFLFFVEVFSVLTVHGGNPAEVLSVTLLFDILDAFLAVAATIRLLGAQSRGERRFFLILTPFTWVEVLLPAIHNRVLVVHDYVWLDLLVSAPYLFLAVLLNRPVADTAHDGGLLPDPNPALRRIVQSMSPIFLSLGLLTLGIMVSQTHFLVGLVASLFAILGYGIQNTLLQSEGMESEESLRATTRSLEELVSIDALTHIANRRAFDEALDRECSNASRTRQPLSLLMVDVDHFKLLNDSSGHQLGDTYLVQIAQALRSALTRSGDFIGRYGGEEFGILLPATGQMGAAEVARKLHLAVAELSLVHPAASLGIISISIGYSTFDGTETARPGTLLLAADRALYRAKHNGRDRSEFLAFNETIGLY